MPKAPRSIPHSLQDLPPKWAHFCLHIEHFIKDELEFDPAGKKSLVAFSGGVDSTALLLVMHYLSRKHGGEVVAVHLNHGLRPEADDDHDWCKQFCNQTGITFLSDKADIQTMADEQGMGLEEAGRIARYALFESSLKTCRADIICLGHHLDDLSEDVLMRLIRGTGWPGLSGMPGYDRKRQILRPFLLTHKKKLSDFLGDIGISWREDTTNADEAMTRNRVRHSILPLFKGENTNFGNAIARLWRIGQLDNDFWHKLTDGLGQTIPNELLENAHKTARLRYYKAGLDAVEGGQVLADTLFKLDVAWQKRRVGTVFQFPGEKYATITASGVVFSSNH